MFQFRDRFSSKRSIRAVASLTVPGGLEFHFPHFFSNFDQVFLYFLKLYFFPLILALRVGDLPTQEDPGYATALHGGCFLTELTIHEKYRTFKRLAFSKNDLIRKFHFTNCGLSIMPKQNNVRI